MWGGVAGEGVGGGGGVWVGGWVGRDGGGGAGWGVGGGGRGYWVPRLAMRANFKKVPEDAPVKPNKGKHKMSQGPT